MRLAGAETRILPRGILTILFCSPFSLPRARKTPRDFLETVIGRKVQSGIIRFKFGTRMPGTIRYTETYYVLNQIVLMFISFT